MDGWMDEANASVMVVTGAWHKQNPEYLQMPQTPSFALLSHQTLS
jgi:hypothetical protein